MTTSDAEDLAAFFLRLMESVGAPAPPNASILDFGCGDGALVDQLLSAGIDAYGCDFAHALGDGERLSAIADPYRLPFADASFDAVVSWQVFEHVQDYDQALRQIRRVLRSDGVSVHVFSPRWTLIEPHLLVPLGTIIQSRPWLVLWAVLGIRNRFQKGEAAKEVARFNENYLREQTTYYSGREVLRRAGEVFADARFLTIEPLAVSPWPRAQKLYVLARRFPALATLRASFRSRTLLLS